jgi:hypothetical protein
MGTAVKKTRGLTFDQMGKTENFNLVLVFNKGTIPSHVWIWRRFNKFQPKKA